MNLVVDIKQYTKYTDIVNQLVKLLNSNDLEIDVLFSIEEGSKIGVVLLFISALRKATLDNKNVRVFIKGDIPNEFVSLNLYDELGFLPNKSVNNKDDILKICCLTNETCGKINDDLTNTLENIDELANGIDRCLAYCFCEIADNIIEHSTSLSGGLVVAKIYPDKKIIDINIVDSGCGIYHSIIKNTKLKIENEKQAIQLCIREGYTGSDSGHRGKGLYHTTNFIKDNGGMFLLYSGGNALYINGGKDEMYSNLPYWYGTFIHMEIRIDVEADINRIFDNDIPTMVEEYDDMINDLW